MAGVIGTVLNGLGNLTSGGTWALSGADVENQKFSALEAEKARAFSAQEAQKQRNFERTISNTAYQRAVEDLKGAGLNPYLAYQQGGASTPSGAVAQPVSAFAVHGKGNTGESPLGTVAKILSSALSLAWLGTKTVKLK